MTGPKEEPCAACANRGIIALKWKVRLTMPKPKPESVIAAELAVPKRVAAVLPRLRYRLGQGRRDALYRTAGGGQKSGRARRCRPLRPSRARPRSVVRVAVQIASLIRFQ